MYMYVRMYVYIHTCTCTCTYIHCTKNIISKFSELKNEDIGMVTKAQGQESIIFIHRVVELSRPLKYVSECVPTCVDKLHGILESIRFLEKNLKLPIKL